MEIVRRREIIAARVKYLIAGVPGKYGIYAVGLRKAGLCAAKLIYIVEGSLRKVRVEDLT
jgi:hypothetical protein